jgi:hypothetical protein
VGEVINLNKVRKAREKAAAAETASGNRAKHGRTKAERSLEKARSDKAEAHLNGHQRKRAGDDEESQT